MRHGKIEMLRTNDSFKCAIKDFMNDVVRPIAYWKTSRFSQVFLNRFFIIETLFLERYKYRK